MKNLSLLVVMVFACASCSLLFNAHTTRVDIHSTHPTTIVMGTDTINTVNNSATIKVKRQEAPLQFSTLTDSTLKTYSVNSRLSSAYWGNIFFAYGLGYIFDNFSSKRFTYPRELYINPLSPNTKIRSIGNYNHKGELYFNVSIPEVNFLQQYSYFAGRRNNAGFMGLSVGMDYYYHPSMFVNFTASSALTFDLPFPVAIDYFGPRETANTNYISLSNNHSFNFLTVGYGLSFSENYWRYFNDFGFGGYQQPYYSIYKHNYALGFVFPLYVKLGRHFQTGVIYRPTFFRPYEHIPFVYEHLISIDLIWKFKLTK